MFQLQKYWPSRLGEEKSRANCVPVLNREQEQIARGSPTDELTC